MPHEKRLAFMAQGLPIILSSAQSLWQASRHLEKEKPREASVLRGLAEEEAAKILILVDAARCPSRIIASKIGTIMQWFYDHLARQIYAEATKWRPVNVAQLRKYVDSSREAYFREGSAGLGEYIFPNWHIYTRESVLYADIQAGERGDLSWSNPADSVLGPDEASRHQLPPFSLVLAEAMSALGIFTLGGLKATSEIWGKVEFVHNEGSTEKEALLDTLLTRLDQKDLLGEEATDDHVTELVKFWQLPMYNLEFDLLEVSMQELQAERDAELLQWVL